MAAAIDLEMERSGQILAVLPWDAKRDLFLSVREQSPDQSRQTAWPPREGKRAPTEGALWRLMETASEPPVSSDPPPAD